MSNGRRGRLEFGAAPRPEPTREERKIDLALRRAAELQIEAGPLRVCDPQDTDDRKLHRYLLTIEPMLVEVGRQTGDFEIFVGLIDKSRQNPINKLGGVDGAGEMAMKAYWSVADRATSLMCSMEGFDLAKLDLIRVSPTSDEGIFLMGGRDISCRVKERFGPGATLGMAYDRAWAIARKELDLSSYEYSLEIPDGHGGAERLALDLEAFSRVLWHPEMIVACHSSVSEPRRIAPDEKGGFINDEIRGLENREVAFYDLLPKSFRGRNGGSAEVESPFFTNLAKAGESEKGTGAYLEIKLAAKNDEADALLQFVCDSESWKGTSKGYAEIFSRRFGMRAFNTFIGKARTNSILTPIAQALGDIAGEHCAVLPMNGGYMNYWVDMPANGATAYLVRKAIERRMSGGGCGGCLELGLEPSVSIVEATGMKLADMRARFILNSLGKDLYPARVLDMTDFLLNFIENVHPAVQRGIFEALAKKENGGRRVSMEDLDNMQMLRRVCSLRRTIRDTEDIVWTLRRDDSLPDDIKSRNGGLETWLFEFAYERFERIFRLLALRIKQEMDNRATVRRCSGKTA